VTLKVPGKHRLFAAIAFAGVFAALGTTAYALDSSLDPTFDGPAGNGNGKFSLPITAGNTNDTASDVAIQADGKIVVGGSTDVIIGPGRDDDFAIARFNTNGTLDASFGGDGVVTTKVAGDQDDFVSALAIQGDGKIVVAGGADMDASSAFDFDFAIARYNTDGTLDTDADTDPGVHLDNDGIFTTAVGSATNSDDEAADLALQPLNGKIVAGGLSEQTTGGFDFALVRLNAADGSLDAGFDGDAAMPGFPGDGKVTTDFAAGDDNTTAIAIQSDDKIVLAGEVDINPGGGGEHDFGLARYNEAGGTLDTGFDTDGKVTTGFTGADAPFDLAIQPGDGKLVAVGHNGLQDFALARYNASDGSLDAGFDGNAAMPGFPGNGKVTTPFNGAFALGVAIQADGKIVAAGREDVDPTASSDFDFALTRYNGANGALDPAFAGDGILTDSLAPAPSPDLFTDVAIGPGGRILAVGSSTITGNANDWALARYGFNPPPIVTPPIVTPPIVTPSTVSPPATTFNLAAAIKRCKKKFPKGKKRKRCIRRAKRHAAAT
jgi:uncharacterized delta-60 repeat protein